VPNRPTKPIITRAGEKGTAVHVFTTLEPNGSSIPTNWAIYVCKVLENGETDPPLVFDVSVPVLTKAKSSQIAESAKNLDGPRMSVTARDSNESLLSLVTPFQMSHLVESLTPGRYHVKVLASNAMGKSPTSIASEDIDLGMNSILNRQNSLFQSQQTSPRSSYHLPQA
jgi:hypothetical protein